MQLRSKADTFALTYLHKSILILLSGIPVLKDVLCIAWSNEIGNFVEECFWFSSIYCLKWCKMKYIWSSCARLLSTCVCDHRRFSLRRRGALRPHGQKKIVWLPIQCVFFISSQEQKKYANPPTLSETNSESRKRFSLPRLRRTGARIAYVCDHDWLQSVLHIGAVRVFVFIVLLSATRARNIWYHSACSCRPSNESVIGGLDCDIDTVVLDKLGSSAITLILY